MLIGWVRRLVQERCDSGLESDRERQRKPVETEKLGSKSLHIVESVKESREKSAITIKYFLPLPNGFWHRGADSVPV